MVEYDWNECDVIKGLRREELVEQLGYLPRSCVIHRDHLVLI
jgi:glutamate 5-kinase